MPPNAAFNTAYFPQHLTLVTVAENMLPIGHWMAISKDPFRLLIAMQLGNYSLGLLRKYGEAALHMMPWSERERVARAGYLSGSSVNKAEKLGYSLVPAQVLQHTRLVEGAEAIYETVLHSELPGLSHEFALFALDVVATYHPPKSAQRQPILYLSDKDFATLGERWQYKR